MGVQARHTAVVLLLTAWRRDPGRCRSASRRAIGIAAATPRTPATLPLHLRSLMDRSVYDMGGAMEDTGQLRVGSNTPRQATSQRERVKRTQRGGNDHNAESRSTVSHTPVRLIRLRDVCYRTGLSRTTIWRLERRNAFPKHRQISSNTVGWIEHEVTAWIESRAMGPTAVQP